MKELLSFSVFIIGIIPLCAIFAQDKQILSDKPAGQYDESKVQKYTLPDPLLMVNGERVTDTAVWNGRRRREILEMFETYVYGKATVNRPEGMHWETTAEVILLNNCGKLNGLAEVPVPVIPSYIVFKSV